MYTEAMISVRWKPGDLDSSVNPPMYSVVLCLVHCTELSLTQQASYRSFRTAC